MKWSYSKWSMFHKCPSQYEWHYLLKKPRSTSPQLERGIDIHKKAENFVKGDITGFPDELKQFKREFVNLRKAYAEGDGFTEADISYNSDYEHCTGSVTDYFTGYIDYLHFKDLTSLVIDYKTGKSYPEHEEQGSAYANAIFINEPAIEQVTAEFWYLDYGTTKDFTWDSDDAEELKKLWDSRAKDLEKTKRFKPTPNKMCGYCMRNKKNGGDCNG